MTVSTEVLTSATRVIKTLINNLGHERMVNDDLNQTLRQVRVENGLVVSGLILALEEEFAAEGLDLPESLSESTTINALIFIVQSKLGAEMRLKSLINQMMVNRRLRGPLPVGVKHYLTAITPEARLINDLGFREEFFDNLLIDIETEFSVDFDIDFIPETVGEILVEIFSKVLGEIAQTPRQLPAEFPEE